MQCDTVSCIDCLFQGVDSQANPFPSERSTTYGWYQVNTGNAKNYRVVGGPGFNTLKYGIHWQEASGYFLVEATGFTSISEACLVACAANMRVSQCEAEVEARAGGRFLDNFGVGAHAGFVHIDNCQLFLDRSQKRDSENKPDDVCIRYAGELMLTSNFLQNTAHDAHEFVIELGNPYDDDHPASNSSLISMNNFYQNSVDFLPVLVGGAVPGIRGDFARDRNMRITSRHDLGGIGGRLRQLKPYSGTVEQHGRLAPYIDAGLAAGVKVTGLAEIRRSLMTFEVDHTALIAHNAVQTLPLWSTKTIPQGRYKIVSVICETEVPFSGLGSDLQASIGRRADPDSYILAHDISSAPILVD